jgi:hypothetical protein
VSRFLREAAAQTVPSGWALPLPSSWRGGGRGGGLPLRLAGQQRLATVSSFVTPPKKSSILQLVSGSEPPTPYPSPRGGGGLKRCAGSRFLREAAARSVPSGGALPLPSPWWGGGRGGGLPLRLAGQQRLATVSSFVAPPNKSSILQFVSGSEPPTPHPSPRGGGGLRGCAVSRFLREAAAQSVPSGGALPLPSPSWGGGRGGGAASPAGRATKAGDHQFLRLAPPNKSSILQLVSGSEPPTPHPSPQGGGGLRGCAVSRFLREAAARSVPSGGALPLPSPQGGGGLKRRAGKRLIPLTPREYVCP